MNENKKQDSDKGEAFLMGAQWFFRKVRNHKFNQV